MSDKQEAWKVIAGEWPPGESVSWYAFTYRTGISRRKYAELIAPKRVRECAEKLGALYVFTYTHERGEHYFKVAWETANISPIGGRGPDICSAALAAIEAMKGAE